MQQSHLWSALEQRESTINVLWHYFRFPVNRKLFYGVKTVPYGPIYVIGVK